MKLRSIPFTLLVATTMLIVSTKQGIACSDHEYESCLLGACVCLPKVGGTVGEAWQHGKKELQGQLVGAPLEQWITASRNIAINGAMPIPPNIREALTEYASEDSMNRVRYKVGDNGFVNLANNNRKKWKRYCGDVDGDTYFFAYDMEGNVLLSPAVPSRVGTNPHGAGQNAAVSWHDRVTC